MDQTQASRLLLLLSLPVLGCSGSKGSPPVTDSTPDITIETGIASDDTAPDTDTSGDDTGTTTDPTVQALALFPDGLTVHPGAAFALRSLATWEDGAQGDVSADQYTSEDEAVAQIDAKGRVTAVGPGTTTLHAAYGGHTAQIGLTVADDGLLSVLVIDADTGAPVPDARVKIDGATEGSKTDSSGRVVVDVSSAAGGPLAVHVYDDPHVPVTVWGTVSRTLTIPLPSDETFFGENATVAGTMDFGAVEDPSALELVIGLVVPSFRDGPLVVEPRDLLAQERSITIYGVSAEVPENLTVEGVADDYAASAPPGQGAVWTLAGPLAISEVTSSLNGTGDAIALLENNLDAMVWSWSATGALSSGATTALDVAPAQRFSRSVVVEQPALSAGFAGTEAPLLLVGSWLTDAGMIATGLGLGTSDAGSRTIQAAPAPADPELTGEVAAIVAQVSGLGSGGPICSAWAPLESGRATLPSLQNVPAITDFDHMTHQFALATDPRAHLVRVLVQARDGSARLLYLDGGAQAGDLYNPGFPMGYGATVWSLLALETAADTFEGLATHGSLQAEDLAPLSWTSAQVSVGFQGGSSAQ